MDAATDLGAENTPSIGSIDQPIDGPRDERSLARQATELAAHLRLALGAGELGTWHWNRGTGTVVWDEQLERLFGLGPGEFDGTFETYVSLLHPDERDAVLATVDDAVARKGSYSLDHRTIWRDGTVRWLQGRGTVTLDEHGEVTGTIGCVGDISARKVAEIEADQRAQIAAEAALQERRERQRLEFLVRLTDVALAATDHRQFMQAVTSAAVPDLGDWCSLHFIANPNAAPLVAVAHRDPAKVAWAEELSERYPYDPDAPTGVAAVVRTGKLQYLPEVTSEVIEEAIAQSNLDADELRSVIDALDPSSSITVPLATKRGIVGAMQFVTAESGRRYEQTDVSLAQAAAGRIAEALDGLWQTEQQLRIATKLQAALLPPTLPVIDGLDVAARYWAAGASDVGGDFYDVFPIQEDRWAIVIGDVCGNGPDAAAVTSIARHTIRAAARHGHDHETVLDWLNEAILNSNRGLFATTCYATVDRSPGGWELTSRSGGHPLPIHALAGGTTERLGQAGTLLGVFDQVRSSVVTTTVAPGDTVIFYTDGITDLAPPHGMTDEEFAEIVADAAQAVSADDVAEEIQRRISERLPITERHDDIAIVVIRATAGLSD